MNRILCVPGWATDRWIFSKVESRLDSSVAVEYVDWTECLTSERCALTEALAAAEQPVTLVGWSLGSMVVLQAAIRQPDKVAAMVLVSPFLRFTEDAVCTESEGRGRGPCPGVDPRKVAAMRRRIGRSPEKVLGDFATACAAPVSNKEFHEIFLTHAQSISVDSLSAGLDYLSAADIRSSIANIPNVPVFVIYGDEDQIVPPESSWMLAECIGNSVSGKDDRLADRMLVEAIGSAGHALPWFHAEAVAAAIREVTA